MGFARIPYSIDSAVVDFASGLDFSRATGCVRCVRVFFGNYWSVWTQHLLSGVSGHSNYWSVWTQHLLECLDTALEHTAVVGFARIPFSIDSAVVDFASRFCGHRNADTALGGGDG